jgi:hypothetical protein
MQYTIEYSTEDFDRNFSYIKYFFMKLDDKLSDKDFEKLKNNIPLDMHKDREKLINIYHLGKNSSNILQIGFNPYKIVLFLIASQNSLITIVEKNNQYNPIIDFLNDNFNLRINFIFEDESKGVETIVTKSFEKFDLIHTNIVENINKILRICFYIANKKTILFYDNNLNFINELISSEILVKNRMYLYETENQHVLKFLLKMYLM